MLCSPSLLFIIEIPLRRAAVVHAVDGKGALDRQLRTVTPTRSLEPHLTGSERGLEVCVFPCTSYNPSVYLAMHCVGITQPGQRLAKPSRTCCRARLHGKQRSGTHTASCGGARSRRLHSAVRRRHARVRAAAADAWRDNRCTSGSSPESLRDRRIPPCSKRTRGAALCRAALSVTAGLRQPVLRDACPRGQYYEAYQKLV
jgi:hypothetical protein